MRKRQPKYMPIPIRPKEPEGVWRDATSYSQNEPRPRIPRSWRMKAGEFNLWVGNSHIYYPGQWVCKCDLLWDVRACPVDTRESAMDYAVAKLRATLEEATRVTNGIITVEEK